MTSAIQRRHATQLPPPSPEPPQESMGKAVAASRRLFAKAARVELSRATRGDAGSERAARGDAGSERATRSDAVDRLVRRPTESRFAARLDAFFAAMHGPYSVSGERVRVTPHFRSLLDPTRTPQESAVKQIKAVVGEREFARLALAARRATGSRGSAEDIRRVTQSLVDAGALGRYPNESPARAIRRLMWDLGIGLDCRGYVAQAFLHARGSAERAARGARYGLSDPGHFVFPTAFMKKVEVTEARAGDIIRLSPVGGRDHNVIVRSCRRLTLPASGALHVGGHVVPRAFAEQGRTAAPRLLVLEVDSAWGGGLDGSHGGVERRIWIKNEDSGRWAHFAPNGELVVGSGPYGHDLMGVYRAKDE